MDDSYLLEFSSVSKSLGGTPILSEVDFTLHAGQVLALVGPNGTGKTTTSLLASGVISPDTGHIDVSSERVGFAPQSNALQMSLTCHQNLEFYCWVTGIRDRNAVQAEISRVVDELSLGPVMSRQASDLSGGQLRRTNLAVALLGSPRLLVLDEVTAGADPESRKEVLSAVAERVADGAGVLYTTHYLEELPGLATHLAKFEDGSLVVSRFEEAISAADPRATLRITSRALDGSVHVDDVTVGAEMLDELCELRETSSVDQRTINTVEILNGGEA